MTTKAQLGIRDLWSLKEFEVGPQHQARRRVGRSIQNIMNKLIRLDASVDEINQYAEQLEQLETALEKHDRIDQMSIFKKLVNQEGEAEDILNITDYDILTGLSTPVSLPLKTWIEGDKIKGSANVGIQYQGPPGRVHGGIIAATFDVLLAGTQNLANIQGFTGTLSVKYLGATPINTDLELEAEVVKIEGRKLFNRGRILVNGEVTAEAEGIWIQVKGGVI